MQINCDLALCWHFYYRCFLNYSDIFCAAMSLDNSTPFDLYTCIRQACDKLLVDQRYSTADDQIGFVLGAGWHKQLDPINDWFHGQVVPVLDKYQQTHSAKQLTTAQQHKQMADMYMGMVEKSFADKALNYLSQVHHFFD